MRGLFLFSILIILSSCNQGHRNISDFLQGPQKVSVNANSCKSAALDPDSRWAEYNELLNRYVSCNQKVFYSQWAQSEKDKKKLQSLVEELASEDVDALSDNELKAFYINAYNMLTLKLIVENYTDLEGAIVEGKSIKNIRDLDNEVWNSELAKTNIAGTAMTLNQIEHGAIFSRPKDIAPGTLTVEDFDARVHMAVNCASAGCPPLRRLAFEGEALDQQLDEMAKAFINEPYYVTVTNKIARVTELLSWFAEDFKNDKRFGSVLKFLKKYHQNSESFEKLDTNVYLTYDWRLNEEEAGFQDIATSWKPSQKKPDQKQPVCDDGLPPIDSQSDWYGYAQLLEKYVNCEGDVRYSYWAENSQDLLALRKELKKLEDVDLAQLSLDEEELKAFYINAYNILTLHLILDNYDQLEGSALDGRSIRNIRGVDGHSLDWAVWDHEKATTNIGGFLATLNQIEKKLLLDHGNEAGKAECTVKNKNGECAPIVGKMDARIHVAVNCASIGCPVLHRRPFETKSLNETLEFLSKNFVNQSKYVQVEGSEARTTILLEWYKADFAEDERYGSVLKFVQRYHEKAHEIQLVKSDLDYDWHLNTAPLNDKPPGTEVEAPEEEPRKPRRPRRGGGGGGGGGGSSTQLEIPR